MFALLEIKDLGFLEFDLCEKMKVRTFGLCFKSLDLYGVLH